MNQVINIDKNTALELRQRPIATASDEDTSGFAATDAPTQAPPLVVHITSAPASEEDQDTAGFAAGNPFSDSMQPEPIIPLSLLRQARLVIVCDPRPGPFEDLRLPKPSLTGGDVQGFMMNLKHNQPGDGDNGVNETAYGSPGFPFKVVIEWVQNPAATWGKYFFGSFD